MPPCHDCSESDLAEMPQATPCRDQRRDPVAATRMADEILDAFHYACDARDAEIADRLLDALASLLCDLPDDAPLRRGPAALVWRHAIARLHTLRG